MFSFVASDLDGTLLNQDHELSPYTKSVLQQLHKRGIHFAFATGRHHLDVAKLKKYVATPADMITSNGARIHSPNGKVIYQNFIAPYLLEQIFYLFLGDSQVRVHLYDQENWLCSAIEPLMSGQNYQTGFMPKLFNIGNPPTHQIFKVFVTCADPKVLEQYLTICQTQFGNQITLTSSGKHFLEINAANDSKGNALQFIINKLDLDMASTIVFGDSMNDQSMLEIAGRGLITDNADPRLTTALPHLDKIGHHADNAVAKYLSTHLITERIP